MPAPIGKDHLEMGRPQPAHRTAYPNHVVQVARGIGVRSGELPGQAMDVVK
jgi:hypothetical protein